MAPDLIKLMEIPVKDVGPPFRISWKSLVLLAFGLAEQMPVGPWLRVREVFMRTLVIGVVIAIVFLATYFVSNMQRIW